MTTLVKHLDGKHDQMDHGLWAKGVASADVPFQRKQDAIKAAKPLDLTAMRVGGRNIRTMDDGEVARRLMLTEYNLYRTREMDRMRSKWEAQNPGEEWSIGKVEDDLPRLAVEVMNDDGLIQAKRDEVAASDPSSALREAFTHTFTLRDGRTLTTEVEDVYGSGGQWTISGRHVVDGRSVGNWTRSMRTSVEGAESVYNASQTIQTAFQGFGIANTFNDAMETIYLASGIKRVTVTAADLRASGAKNARAGAFVWAMQGFDWDSRSSSFGPHSALRRYVTTPEFRALPRPIQDSIESVDNRLTNMAFSDPNYPTPREIATLGMLPGEKWWPGKAIMNHNGRTHANHVRATGHGGAPGWSGVKVLTPEGLRVSDGQVISYQARQQVQNDPEMLAAVQRAFGQSAAARGRTSSGSTSSSRSEAARRAWETRRRNASAAQIAEQQRQAAIRGAA